MKVPDVKKNISRCLCPKCPTYLANSCPIDKGEILYCAKGETQCILPDKGCVCGMCPIWEEYKLSKGYFCFNGKAGNES